MLRLRVTTVSPILDTMHIYFSGIGGVGIGPLAMLALDAGHTVSGSDLQESPITQSLKSRGVTVNFGQDGSHIASVQATKPIDWFVYSSALPEDNAELIYANSLQIKATKRDEFLNFFLDEKNLELIAVAGTHGKTTTSAMIVWLFQQFNIPVSYSVGTTLSFGPSAQFANGSRYFIYECDEFDKNFLQFHPTLSVIPAIDYDHPDTYPNEEAYHEAFRTFIMQSKQTYMWASSASLVNMTDSKNLQLFSDSDLNIERTPLPGRHMRRNAWLAANTAQHLMPTQDLAALSGLLKDFPGTGRRFEKIAENIYSDYAHHPVEIAATIQAAKEINKNVIVVYQPHQNIRQHEILRENAYRNCFNGVRYLYWLPTYLSREKVDLPVLSASQLLASLNPDIAAEYAEMNDTLWQKIKHHAQDGDLVITMSAGNLDTWLRTKADHQ